MPDGLFTFFAAMTPIGELRASIPLGIVRYDMPWAWVLMLSIAGNLVPVPVILLVLHRAGERLEAMENPIGALLRWRTGLIRRRWSGSARRYDMLTIFLLVAVPLPFTGAWTGSLAVWALRLDQRRGFVAIAGGVAAAGLVVTALVLGGVEAFRRLD